MKPKDNELQRRSGSDPVLPSGARADISSPPLHPVPDEPTTYFEIERRKSAAPEIGGDKIGGDLPPMPASSPWAGDPVPDEPTIDRREDGDIMGTPIDQLP
jgi:hypothetical protein